MAYKTPGVYVEEISTLAPSVVAVETAVPVFIGYSERAENAAGNDVRFVPTRIRSLLEYQQFYGGDFTLPATASWSIPPPAIRSVRYRRATRPTPSGVITWLPPCGITTPTAEVPAMSFRWGRIPTLRRSAIPPPRPACSVDCRVSKRWTILRFWCSPMASRSAP
ncbi:hypothetical protein [Lysobacter gummosus]|uniref:hypothetical protein n=1 Tax=Lysobacter gummosus TaxID=262324 RepID=UPI00362D683A